MTRAGGVLGLLLSATDEPGTPLSTGAVRDQAVTLLFAGHDTTTTTFTFLVHELGRNPRGARGSRGGARPGPRPREPDRGGTRRPGPAGARAVAKGDAPALSGRLGGTAAHDARRRPSAACRSRPKSGVHYSSWATHHLPQLYPDPFQFDPDRFLPEREAALPRGAYVPFGGGSRMCLGKRFGEYELRALAAVLFRRVRLEPLSPRDPRVVTTPTLGPKGGLRFVVRTR